MKTLSGSRLKTDSHYLRNPDALLLSSSGQLQVYNSGTWASVNSEIPEALTSFLEMVLEPISGEILHQAILAMPEPFAREVQACLPQLLDSGALLEDSGKALEARLSGILPKVPEKKPCKHLVVGVSGGSGAAFVRPTIQALNERFCDRIDVIFTESSLKFITQTWFKHAGIRTWSGVDEIQDEIRVPHIQLAQSADLVVIAPASAHFLQRLATGACSDLLSIVATATTAPVVLVPSMNQLMWQSPAVSRNIAQLRRDGFHIVEPRQASAMADAKEAKAIHLGGAGTANRIELMLATLEKVLELRRG